MVEHELYLVTQETCPKCKAIKKLIEEKNVSALFNEMTPKKDLSILQELGVKTCPALVIDFVKGEQYGVITDYDEMKKLIEGYSLIYQVLGNASV